MLKDLFYRVDPFFVGLALWVLVLVAEETGFRAMRTRRKGLEKVENADIAVLLGAVLTLLSLMLGFTYAMSQGRFETRRQLTIDEANAIGTAYLRAKTLPQPQSSEIQEALRRYAALRVEVSALKDPSRETIRKIDGRSKELHDAMWSPAAALAGQRTDPVVAIFYQALNEVFDLHAKRLAAFRDRVPFSVYLVLFGIVIGAFGLIGSYFATRPRRMRGLTIIFAILVAAVMWLILDLDSPARGSIRASQQSLIDLQQDLGPPARDRD